MNYSSRLPFFVQLNRVCTLINCIIVYTRYTELLLCPVGPFDLLNVTPFCASQSEYIRRKKKSRVPKSAAQRANTLLSFYLCVGYKQTECRWRNIVIRVCSLSLSLCRLVVWNGGEYIEFYGEF